MCVPRVRCSGSFFPPKVIRVGVPVQLEFWQSRSARLPLFSRSAFYCFSNLMSDIWTKVGTIGSRLGGTLTVVVERYVLALFPVRVEDLVFPRPRPPPPPVYSAGDHS